MSREIKFRAVHGEREYRVETKQPKRAIHKGFYRQHGYIKRLVTEHPLADKRGYVMEHRLVVEENTGKFLPKHAVIHHKNGIRDDNSLENLEIIQEQARHAKGHDKGLRNPNGRFVANEPIFNEISFRLLNKNTGLTQVYPLSKLIGTTFRNSQFEFRGRFTGLHDKNNKEIYEGDIIRGGRLQCTGNFLIENEKTVVRFEGGMFKAGKISLCSFKRGCEVIGDIYSNPELLGGENNG
jgi:hypothetical protein